MRAAAQPPSLAVGAAWPPSISAQSAAAAAASATISSRPLASIRPAVSAAVAAASTRLAYSAHARAPDATNRRCSSGPEGDSGAAVTRTADDTAAVPSSLSGTNAAVAVAAAAAGVAAALNDEDALDVVAGVTECVLAAESEAVAAAVDDCVAAADVEGVVAADADTLAAAVWDAVAAAVGDSVAAELCDCVGVLAPVALQLGLAEEKTLVIEYRGDTPIVE